MRITQSTVVQQFIYNLQQNQQSILTTEQQLSSGKRLLLPQDNPGGAAIAMQEQAQIDGSTQNLSNDQSAQSWISASGTALQNAGTVLQQAQSLGLQVNSPATSIPAITQTMGGLQSQLFTIANSQFNGEYLFAGTDVTAATTVIGGVTTSTPYTQTAATTNVLVSTVVGGVTATVTYSVGFTSFAYAGTTNTLTREIAPSTHMQVGVQGDVFVQAMNDFSVMVGALQAGASTPAMTAVATATFLPQLQSDLTSIETAQAVTGSWQQRLTQTTSTLQTLQTSTKNELSNTQDVDVASAIVNLQQEQLAYQTALGVGAQLQQTTLLNYLKP